MKIQTNSNQNERICASAIYYYDNDNITESLLSFRTRARTDDNIYYPQDQHGFLQQVYGFGPDVHGGIIANYPRSLEGLSVKKEGLSHSPTLYSIGWHLSRWQINRDRGIGKSSQYFSLILTDVSFHLPMFPRKGRIGEKRRDAS